MLQPKLMSEVNLFIRNGFILFCKDFCIVCKEVQTVQNNRDGESVITDT